MPDAHEALWKDLQQEAPQELIDRQGSELLLIVVRRIFVVLKFLPALVW